MTASLSDREPDQESALVQVTCSEPYEWTDPTIDEWEFSAAVKARAGSEPFHVSPHTGKILAAEGT